MFKSASQFSLHIEQLAIQNKMTCMEAILLYCEDNCIEPDEIKTLVNKSLRDKIEIDMREANLLPKRATLDV